MNDRYEIQDVLSRYVRANDERDHAALAALFAEDGVFRFFGRSGTGKYQLSGEAITGAGEIKAFAEGWPPLAERLYLHHMTTDHVIEVDGDQATMNAQFVVMSTVADAEPEGGWPKGLLGVQGSITPIMIGLYDSDLRSIDGVWKLTRLDVLHSLPHSLPTVNR
ncbi:nuclear transport factor 2 family protein [Streptomyces sp. CA-106110]|uniref:nuclear transport factor 2 family protein n=1 Tax=Streptomyces sp. CA-106110 TaxID=3240044 RepID=UPI003D924E46